MNITSPFSTPPHGFSYPPISTSPGEQEYPLKDVSRQLFEDELGTESKSDTLAPILIYDSVENQSLNSEEDCFSPREKARRQLFSNEDVNSDTLSCSSCEEDSAIIESESDNSLDSEDSDEGNTTDTEPSAKIYTPEKNYPLQIIKKKDGLEYIQPQWTPRIRKRIKKGDLICYRWKKVTTEERCPGETSNFFSRINNYTSEANRARRGDTEDVCLTSQAIAKSPTKFVIGIIKKAKDQEECDRYERTARIVNNTTQKGFSRRGGNGGGVAHSPNSKKVSEEQRQEIETHLKENFENIEWRKFIKRKKRIRHTLTQNEKKARDAVYCISYTTHTPQKVHKLQKLYFGYAGVLGKRMNTHNHYANNPHKRRAQRQEMYQHLHNSPEKCAVGKVPITPLKEKKISSAAIETVAIQTFDTIKTGFNQVNGGGGGKSRKP